MKGDKMLTENKYLVLQSIVFEMSDDKYTTKDDIKKEIASYASNGDCKVLCACVDADLINLFMNDSLTYSLYELTVKQVADKAGVLKMTARRAIAWWAAALGETLPEKNKKKKSSTLRGKTPANKPLQGDVARPFPHEPMGSVPMQTNANNPSAWSMPAQNSNEEMGDVPDFSDLQVMGEPPEPEHIIDDMEVMGKMIAPEPDSKALEDAPAPKPTRLMGDVVAINPDGVKPVSKAVTPLTPRPDGKKICSELREIRRKIAEENGIPFETEPCTYDGPCAGTCPKCDEEAAYIERALSEKERNKD